MRKKHLDPLIKNEIPMKLADIEKKAKQAWNDKRGKQRDSLVDFGVVRHVAICHLLVPMAISTSKVMDDLQKSCLSAAREFTTELELDLFGTSERAPALEGAAALRQRAEYLERIIVAAKSGRLKLGTLTRDSGGSEDYAGHMAFVQVESVRDDNKRTTTALQAFRNVIKSGYEESTFVTEHNGPFTVSRHDKTHQPNSQRKGFCTMSSDLTEVVPLQILSQYRAAFELAQACLLFLDSDWFSELCSCGLRCGQLSSSGSFARVDHGFALQTGRPETLHLHLKNVDSGSIGSP